jgi:hypothetical protein
MQKQTIITISREDLFKLLAEKGYAVPSTAIVINGPQDCTSNVEFPIVVSWATVPDSTSDPRA